MKKVILLLAIVGGILFSCKKEKPNECVPIIDPPPIDTIDTIPVINPDTTWANLFRNGSLWNSIKFRGNFQKDTDSTFSEVYCFLTFYDLYQTVPIVKRHLRIWNIPRTTGKYPISLSSNEARARYLIYDVDTPEDWYELDTTVVDNFIEITSYDSLTHFMEGNFNCSLYLSDNLTNPANPTYVEFKNCTFRVKLEY